MQVASCPRKKNGTMSNIRVGFSGRTSWKTFHLSYRTDTWVSSLWQSPADPNCASFSSRTRVFEPCIPPFLPHFVNKRRAQRIMAKYSIITCAAHLEMRHSNLQLVRFRRDYSSPRDSRLSANSSKFNEPLCLISLSFFFFFLRRWEISRHDFAFWKSWLQTRCTPSLSWHFYFFFFLTLGERRTLNSYYLIRIISWDYMPTKV